MRFTHKPRLAAIGFDDDPQIVQMVGHRVVESIVGLFPIAIIIWRFFGEEKPEHGIMTGEGMHDVAIIQNFGDAVLQGLAIGREVGQRVGFIENAQAFLGGGNRDRMRRIGAAMRGAVIAEGAHHILAPGDGGNRVAIGHSLGKGRDIGDDTQQRLDAAARHAKAGFHLVDDQQHAVFIAELAGKPHIFGRGQNAAAIALDRLDQHGGHCVAIAAEHIFEPLHVVHGHQMRKGFQGLRNALGIGDYVRVAVAAGLPILDIGHPHGRVEQPVIAAFNQQITVAPGMRAGQAQGGHHRLGARVGIAHKVHPRHHFGDTVGHGQLALG